MNNAELFKKVFGIYAEEFWAYTETEMLNWIKADVPDTNIGDTISRQAAIDALDALCDRECEYSKKQRSVMCGACHLGSAFDVIEQLPSAERRGKNISAIGFMCSACGFGDFGGFHGYEPKFCPNCGARMALEAIEREKRREHG